MDSINKSSHLNHNSKSVKLSLSRDELSSFVHKKVAHLGDNIQDSINKETFRFMVLPDLDYSTRYIPFDQNNANGNYISILSTNIDMDSVYDYCEKNNVDYVVNYSNLINAKSTNSSIRLLIKCILNLTKIGMSLSPCAYVVDIKFDGNTIVNQKVYKTSLKEATHKVRVLDMNGKCVKQAK